MPGGIQGGTLNLRRPSGLLSRITLDGPAHLCQALVLQAVAGTRLTTIHLKSFLLCFANYITFL